MADCARVRFGVFDFDLASRELRRDGVAVRLQAQPAQALAVLLAHAGEVVTRDTLRQEIWGAETFVDFDRNINFCIAQIRTALGDSADSPRFVRTLPKRGYQFIAPVDRATAMQEPPPPAPAHPFRNRLLRVGVILAASAVAWFIARPKPAAPAITIAVTRFDNQTGDPAFARLADSLTDSVVGELTVAGNGRYAVIGNASILRGPREGRDLLAIGAALQAGYIVIGQVQHVDSGIRILAHLIHLPDQKHLWVVRAESPAGQAAASQSVLARRIADEFSSHLAASPILASR
jgi:DNA-binding winged helix-turn-helix (wHTH) protein/TolB-like protein